MLVEDKLDMYLDMEDMDDSDYINEKNEPKFNSVMSKELFNETNFNREEPLVKRRLRSDKNKPRNGKKEPRIKKSSRKDKRKQFTAKRLRKEPSKQDKQRHSQLIDDEIEMYIDMKNMEEMDEMDALNTEESRKKPRVYMIGCFYSHDIYFALIWLNGDFIYFATQLDFGLRF